LRTSPLDAMLTYATEALKQRAAHEGVQDEEPVHTSHPLPQVLP